MNTTVQTSKAALWVAKQSNKMGDLKGPSKIIVSIFLGGMMSWATTTNARALTESGGTRLPIGAIADGDFLKRSGSDIIGSAAADNFSYEEILSTETITVPARQQMAVFGALANDGVLNLDGSLVMEN